MKVVFLASLILLFLVPVWQWLRTQKLEARPRGYDYIVPLGEITFFGSGGPMVLDKRTGKVWAIGFNTETEKVESEYCGHVDEFVKREGERE